MGDSRITMTGHAQAGATVRLTLRYDGKIIALIPVSGVRRDGFSNCAGRRKHGAMESRRRNLGRAAWRKRLKIHD